MRIHTAISDAFPGLASPLPLSRERALAVLLTTQNKALLERARELHEEQTQAYTVAVSADGSRLIRKPLRLR